jgi:phosphopantothenoylcysteine decarboxylase/phosphopantothenate--cysteine ligase
MILKGKNVVLGVAGGVAIHKSLDLASQLVKRGTTVRVVMTENAIKMVQPLQFQVISRQPVLTDLFSLSNDWKPPHIDLADRADLMAIVPATANIIGKMANGIADDALSTMAISVHCPILVAPAMNGHMFQHPAVQDNMQKLKQRGLTFVEPASGMLACGYEGIGRLNEVDIILSAIENVLATQTTQGRGQPLVGDCGTKQDLVGNKVLVAAGPTREYLDPIRFITNRSSGKMGYAVAEVAKQRGAEVTLVSGTVSLDPPAGVDPIFIETAKEMHQVVRKYSDLADVVVMAAAVADYHTEIVSPQKIKKTAEFALDPTDGWPDRESQANDELTLKLTPTIDIAADLGQRKRPGQVLVTFAAETEDLIQNAKKKLLAKQCDLVVANDVTTEGAGFDTDTNVVTLVHQSDCNSLPMMSKREVAERIFDFVRQKLNSASDLDSTG